VTTTGTRPFRRALLALVLVACTSTRPFTDSAGRVIPGSIATMERIELGGLRQSVWFRARDVKAPALILLHGGPGASEAPLFRHFDAALEDHFLVVYWEQRGAGRSYRSDIPRSSMTIERMLQDLDALVDTVRARFGKDRVVLLGHSWGTILGTLYAAREPTKVSAYVGVAQIANFAEGERVSLEWALDQAEARGDSRARDALRAMAPAPRSVDDELALGRWVERFGGMRQGGLSTGRLIWTALRTDEAGLVDLVGFGRGNRFSLEALRPQYEHIDLTRLRCFAVPVLFMIGRHDRHVPAELSASYFAMIHAPAKRLVWFEHSGHDPPFEEPKAFMQAMLEYVRPLALEPRASPHPGTCSANDVRSGPLDHGN
jgi:pimeloyl-ACP methyl ester carboxylesterase